MRSRGEQGRMVGAENEGGERDGSADQADSCVGKHANEGR